VRIIILKFVNRFPTRRDGGTRHVKLFMYSFVTLAFQKYFKENVTFYDSVLNNRFKFNSIKTKTTNFQLIPSTHTHTHTQSHVFTRTTKPYRINRRNILSKTTMTFPRETATIRLSDIDLYVQIRHTHACLTRSYERLWRVLCVF